MQRCVAFFSTCRVPSHSSVCSWKGTRIAWIHKTIDPVPLERSVSSPSILVPFGSSMRCDLPTFARSVLCYHCRSLFVMNSTDIFLMLDRSSGF